MKTETTWTPDAYQQTVIEAENGYHLVLAPPGCGKTQILTERIRHAHRQGIAYRDMLCVTFTNRAARGMRERIKQHIAQADTDDLYVGNVHRFCSKFLFDNNLVPADSSVIDEDDAISIIARYLDEDEYAVSANPTKRRQYAELIQLTGLMHQLQHSHPRALRIHPECIDANDADAIRRLCQTQGLPFTSDTMIDIYRHTATYRTLVQSARYDMGSRQIIDAVLTKMSLAHHYDEYKRANRMLDFEDLLMLTYDALCADTARRLRRYSWIQVDEVQDLNPLQLAIIDALTAPTHPTVMYLGDEQQAIFSFMGAKIGTLDLLRKRCAGHLHRLFVNHRSPKYLLDVFNTYATHLLGIDPALLPTTDYRPERTGDELQIMSSEQIETEYDDVAHLVKRLNETHPEGTTAVVVSANADADLMSRALTQLQLSHFKVSGDDLFATPAIKLLLAHLNVLAGEHHFIGWSRLLKGLQVFETNAAARAFVRGLADRSMLPTDLLRDDGQTYVEHFARLYEHDELIVFDTETTGLNVFEDDIVQIAAVKMRCGRVVEGSAFSVFMQTDREIPRRLGDIDNPLIAEMSRHTLHSREEGLQMFADYIAGGVLLAHNATYDYHILDNNLRRTLPSVHLDRHCKGCIDSLKLARLLEPELSEYKLKYLLEALHLAGENSHLADADVEATCHVVNHCYAKALQTIPAQQEWISNPRFRRRAQTFRRRYMPIYRRAAEALYRRQPVADPPALCAELQRFYDALCAERLTEPCDKLRYVLHFLTDDMIDTRHTPSLAEQLAVHINEINTLKEPDLCNSATLAERIFVTTVHKAKGLEFDHVVVFDAVDGRYPNYFHRHNPRLAAEDARKFYVAMTRAKRRLYIAWSIRRTDFYNRVQPRQLTPFMQPLLPLFEMTAATDAPLLFGDESAK